MALVFKIPHLTVSRSWLVRAGRKYRTQNGAHCQLYLQHIAKPTSDRIAEPTVGWVVWWCHFSQVYTFYILP